MKHFYWEKIKSKGDQMIKIKKRKYSLKGTDSHPVCEANKEEKIFSVPSF